MPTPMRLRSAALPDIKLEHRSSDDPVAGWSARSSPSAAARAEGVNPPLEASPARRRRRRTTPAATFSSDGEAKEGLEMGKRPARRRAAREEPVEGGADVPGGWGAGGGGGSRTSRQAALLLAAVVSILYLLLVIVRPFARGDAQHPQQQFPPAPLRVQPRAEANVELAPPPSAEELLAHGLSAYESERTVRHRVVLFPPLPPAAAAAADDDDNDGIEADDWAREKLQALARKYGIGLEQLVEDFAALGRGPAGRDG